jgi:DNA-binding HxlR family transcriptional regulator
MFDGMTIFERIILESLEKEQATLQKIKEDTALNENLLARSLQHLVAKNMVRIEKEQYSLNQTNRDEWRTFLQKEENIGLELQELLEGILKVALKKNPQGFMKIKKVHLGERDEIILRAMIKNIETFIHGLEKNSSKNDKTFTKKVVVTGMATYQDIIQSI